MAVAAFNNSTGEFEGFNQPRQFSENENDIIDDELVQVVFL